MRGDPRFESARDELFAHIHRCNVLQATEEQRQEWMEETIEYLAERYPDLAQDKLEELRVIGTRFCQPVIPHGKQHTALTVEEEDTTTETESGAGSLASAV